MATGIRLRQQQGSSLLELLLVLGIVSVLGSVLTAGLDAGALQLRAAQQDILGSLDQAYCLARARGANVTVAVGRASGQGEHLAVRLGSRVRWGKPGHIPFPPGMEEGTVAARTGESHALLTVTPRRTVLANTWYLNDGTEALCLRLNGHGQAQVLRWRADRRAWERA